MFKPNPYGLFSMPTLETERLILRDWRETDLEDMFVFLSNPNVTIPEGASPCKTLEECKRVLDYLIEEKNSYAIEWKENGIVIGSIGLNEDAKKNPAIAFEEKLLEAENFDPYDDPIWD